ncbi:AAA-like domain-containing protein [Vreelandella sp. EE22]
MSEIIDSPKTVLAEMKEFFKESTKGLFSFSREEFFEYEKGVYGLLIAKSSKRISAALGIQKEVLVLITNFQTLQVRTIHAAKKVIDEGEGRFESNMAIVVHQDVNGDMNLKNWGRELGISILPVLYKGNLPEGEELERVLCYELYSHDPFDVTGPVSNDAQFYGRRTEAQDLARKLQLGQIRSLLGVRKIGKTSIINRIISELENYECISIMIDCSRDEIWSMNSVQLMEAVALNVQSAVDNNEKYVRLELPEKYSNKLYESTKLLEKSSVDAGKPIILLFDEVDYITPSSPTSHEWKEEFNKFWRNLRVAYQEMGRSDGILSIVIGGVSSKWFTVGDINGVENSVLSFIPEEYLSPLPRGASSAMIRKIGRMAGLGFSEKAAELVAQESADMPYWIRKMCSYIHRNISVDSRPITIDVDRVQPLLETYINNEGAAIAEVALRHLFGIYPELRDGFDHVVKNPLSELNPRTKNILIRYGLIKDRAGPEVAGNMVREGYLMLQEYNSSDEAIPVIRGELDKSQIELSVGEWADEIAAISKRRNILERKFREITLNFIKMDSFSNSTKKSSKDRILAVLPEKQRVSFSHMSADEIIQKYCWTDLVKLLSTKEWQLFEKIIGDKNAFNLNASVINDRPDAHAKNVDAADFAMYRRSLKFMEDILAKLG